MQVFKWGDAFVGPRVCSLRVFSDSLSLLNRPRDFLRRLRRILAGGTSSQGVLAKLLMKARRQEKLASDLQDIFKIIDAGWWTLKVRPAARWHWRNLSIISAQRRRSITLGGSTAASRNHERPRADIHSL